ncbi:hypothetical protein E2C01_013169 [Portunus trituberculatus]|uniref:Uncharacterized protein n=1 Tax=Portunus trituberculatus TaxID=210409 RepID=A0A5B7DGA7_PORTR|nr:hypothetical protein [Portunus trituberculatus]
MKSPIARHIYILPGKHCTVTSKPGSLGVRAVPKPAHWNKEVCPIIHAQDRIKESSHMSTAFIPHHLTSHLFPVQE